MLDFREELSKVLRKRETVRNAEERNGEAILREVVIPYFEYVAPRTRFAVKTEVTFSVSNDNKNYLEIYVKPKEHQGETIYFNKFKYEDGAMKTLFEIQKIFERQHVMIDHYTDAIENGEIVAKRFTAFLST